MQRRRLALACFGGLLLGLLLAPRPSSQGNTLLPVSFGLSESTPKRLVDQASSLRDRLVMGRTAPALGAITSPMLRPLPPPEPALPPMEPPAPAHATGWISGHVVDGNGIPVGGAVLHLSGPTGSLAHRIADDGEFHFQVSEGQWTVDAGWFDGEDEWRSVTTSAHIRADATATLAIEILLGGAAHAVRSELKETFGVGWEVLEDDGPLKKGDVIVEVGGRLLTDMQPEAVRAALRERPGEVVRATVLRASPQGQLEELPVQLEAR